MDNVVLWFTGLSGSGKSTIADRLIRELKARDKTVLLLDGDSIRETVHKELKFTPEDIRKNNELIAMKCKESIGSYNVIVVSVISPFRVSRELARELLSNHFAEVYIKADLEECKRRDVKGLYKKAIEGKIDNFIGLSENTPYEVPENPHVVLDTMIFDVEHCVMKLLDYLESKERAEL